MAISTGLLQKLEIEAFEDQDFRQSLGLKFKLQINPKSFTCNHTMEYNESKIPGASEGAPRFKLVGPEGLKIDFVLDSTGVVSLPMGKSVKDLIADLKKVVSFEGSEHETPYLHVRWGTNLKFNGRLKVMNIDYTLFDPNGDPLRAKLGLEFISFTSVKMMEKKANKSSPDLTHVVTVKDGDTLPLLCYRIYKDSSYYLKVAEVNGLDNFRNIPPGTKLSFPPLIN